MGDLFHSFFVLTYFRQWLPHRVTLLSCQVILLSYSKLFLVNTANQSKHCLILLIVIKWCSMLLTRSRRRNFHSMILVMTTRRSTMGKKTRTRDPVPITIQSGNITIGFVYLVVPLQCVKWQNQNSLDISGIGRLVLGLCGNCVKQWWLQNSTNMLSPSIGCSNGLHSSLKSFEFSNKVCLFFNGNTLITLSCWLLHWLAFRIVHAAQASSWSSIFFY